MRRIICSLLLLLPFLFLEAQEADSLSYILLKPAEFSEEMTIVNNPVLVDVREPFEYRGSRIEKAINMPSGSDLKAFSDTLMKATHIFLYCTTDFRSIRAAEFLCENGFIHVYCLDGGIAAWRKTGFKVDRKRIRR